tara:strand:- start:92 stop:508 length:417 start_codon:yes stop_codon:yes gene_type:complete
MLANQKYSSKTSLSLMLMGLLPFIFAIYYLEKYDFEIGLSVFIHYSAIILSFIGAINWGRNVEEKNPKIFILSVVPSVIAFGAMFADFPYQLQILTVGFLIAWIIDLSLMFKDKRYYVYLAMRTFITGSVMYLHMYLL